MGGRRLLKAVAVLTALGYCSLLVYQGGASLHSQESRPTAAVQVTDLSLEPAIKTKNVTLDDVFISVKTTKHYQYTRLPLILKTWWQLAKNQTWFFTDTDNQRHQNQTNGHMVNTKCSATHSRQHLCCKMSVEYDYFVESNKKWFCHFDDDNYVNVPRLISILQQYDFREEWYLGRTAIYEPVKLYQYRKHKKNVIHPFWFATGGAGFCISRSLALKMVPVTSGGRFMSVCDKTRFPDDVTIGFIIEVLMKRKLTTVPEFHSHLERMPFLDRETIKNQVSFSYVQIKNEWNVVSITGFDTTYDPTRFLSLHCYLFPHFKFCSGVKSRIVR